jgi:hypothetical protein
MLVPGEYLLVPPQPDQNPQKPANSAGQPTQTPPATQPTAARETEPRSFLLTLLRALGAVHS